MALEISKENKYFFYSKKSDRVEMFLMFLKGVQRGTPKNSFMNNQLWQTKNKHTT